MDFTTLPSIAWAERAATLSPSSTGYPLRSFVIQDLRIEDPGSVIRFLELLFPNLAYVLPDPRSSEDNLRGRLPGVIRDPEADLSSDNDEGSNSGMGGVVDLDDEEVRATHLDFWDIVGRHFLPRQAEAQARERDEL
ncbi:hypothetical protein K523DRAFT_327863 [Schizophyllum commune Tattone D]|nr:hypothetical protein K523DRAFT_327863 [Schizophyllum commune Tattone D]